jgi:multicomponent Na+:H+ antiporter subunit B
MRPTSEARAVRHAAREAQVREPVHRPWLALALAGGCFALFVACDVSLPREGAALPAIARYALVTVLPAWHTTEPVNEIVYGTRGFDTFGETFILLAAVIAVTTLARRREHRDEYVGESVAARAEQQASDPGARTEDAEEAEARAAERAEEYGKESPRRADMGPLGAPAPERSDAMTVVVRVPARAAAVILTVAGVYLAAWGYAPGGGFPAGAVLTGVAVLLYAALGHRVLRRVVRPNVLEPVEMAGAMLIVVTELLGLILSGSFTANWVALAPSQTIRSGGVLQLFSGAELVEVATGLTIAIFALLGMEHEWTPDP